MVTIPPGVGGTVVPGGGGGGWTWRGGRRSVTRNLFRGPSRPVDGRLIAARGFANSGREATAIGGELVGDYRWSIPSARIELWATAVSGPRGWQRDAKTSESVWPRAAGAKGWDKITVVFRALSSFFLCISLQTARTDCPSTFQLLSAIHCNQLQPPSVTVPGLRGILQPPSVTLPRLSVTLQPPSVTLLGLSVTLPPPPPLV